MRRVAVAAVLAAAAFRADGATLPMDEPAVASPNALAALLTAVVRAGTRLVAVGERGVVLLSDDDGAIWRQAESVPASVTLTAVRFIGATEGWATGHEGLILHSVDGGLRWERQLDGVQAAALAAAEAHDVPGPAGEALARRAADLVADGPDKPFLDLVAERPGDLLAVGAYGLAVRSADGGRSWRSAMGEFADPGGLHIYHLAGLPRPVLAVGEQGLLLRSREGGPFEPIAAPGRATLFGALLLPSGAFLAYGVGGLAQLSTDGGATWTRSPTGIAAGVTCAVALRDGGVALGALDGSLLLSRDGGAHFAVAGQGVGMPVSALIEAGDALVAVGARGARRIALAQLDGAS